MTRSLQRIPAVLQLGEFRTVNLHRGTVPLTQRTVRLHSVEYLSNPVPFAGMREIARDELQSTVGWHNASTMTKLLPLLALAAAVALTACASKPKPKEPGIHIDGGLFGPKIDITGIDNDDSTPVSMNIGR